MLHVTYIIIKTIYLFKVSHTMIYEANYGEGNLIEVVNKGLDLRSFNYY